MEDKPAQGLVRDSDSTATGYQHVLEKNRNSVGLSGALDSANDRREWRILPTHERGRAEGVAALTVLMYRRGSSGL